MKYMHFRASCSYTALAEMLEDYGIHTEDDQIALEMKLPWLFAKENTSYIAGPMLQSGKWFSLWLRPHGLIMSETAVSRENLCAYLRKHRPLMLGIMTPYGKHAVVFKKYDGRFHFFNPSYEGSGEKTILALDESELISLTEQTLIVAELHKAEPVPSDFRPYMLDSVSVIRENCNDIRAFAETAHDPDEYISAMNSLFRALLLDGVTMLKLAGENGLADEFSLLQKDFMSFMQGPRTGLLIDVLNLCRLNELSEEYIRLIEKQLVNL